ncbi:MAG TPA: acriflavin resistance protein, partial [Algoriphagus sp.]|nr:acriflavin resistance protein [Algoriphagus sp.]
FPSVDPPIINVRTNYVGANADVIEAQITEPLEEAINGIQGIKSLTSTSNDGASSITVEFDVGADLEAAANDVRDKVSGAQRNLPPDAEPPVVSKADADSQPIVFLNVKSDERSLLDLSDIAQNIFKERLQTIPGVSRVQIWGEKEYAIRLRMDPLKMASYGVTPLDVLSKVQSENVELPSGRIEGETIELSVRTKSRLSSPQEFNQLIIKESENNIVRFQDVGKAELAALNERTVLKRDGVPMVGVVLVPLPGSNNIEIVDEFYRRLEFIKKDLPADVGLEIGFDSTTYIRNSIAEVQETIITAFILVVAIIFLFLRDWRTTFIPVLTIPISLIGVFFVMYLMDFSINVLTLLGIVLSIGLVVDDAIVVLENIYARIEKGEKPLQAAQKGAEEIFFAVIATTVALAAVFLPVIFLTGTTGRLFREFGIVVAGSVII